MAWSMLLGDEKEPLSTAFARVLSAGDTLRSRVSRSYPFFKVLARGNLSNTDASKTSPSETASRI